MTITPDVDATASRVLQLLQDTGFLSPAKRELLPDGDDILHATTALLGCPDLHHSAVTHDERGDLSGFYALTRVYRRTWGAQHLASAGGTGLSTNPLDLIRQVNAFVERTPEVEYARTYHRRENPWPEYVIGRFARALDGHPRSSIREAWLVRWRGRRPTAPPGVETRDGSPVDVPELRRLATSAGWLEGGAPDDLDEEELDLSTIRRVADAHGLNRRRETVVAEHDGAIVGAAFLEFTSPGWSLSRLADATHLLVPDPEPATIDALVAATLESRRADTVPVVFLAAPPVADRIEQLGGEILKRYQVWTAHRSVLPEFGRYLDRRCRLEVG